MKKYILIENNLPEFKSICDYRVEKKLNTLCYIFENISFEEDQRFQEYFRYYIIGIDELSLEKMLINLLFRFNYHLSCAESCTGGLIVAKLIGASGASEVIEESYITYSEKAKSKILDIPLSLIKKYGVVSGEIAEAMAKGLKKKTGVEVAISVTGYAGRDDENDDGNNGMCYFSIIVDDYVHVEKYKVIGNRNDTRIMFTNYILYQLLNILRRKCHKNL